MERVGDIAGRNVGHDRQRNDEPGFVIAGVQSAGLFQAAMRLGESSGEQRDPALHHHDAGVFFGERAEPGDLVGDGAELASVHQLCGLVVDEVCRGGEFAGGEVVLDGIVGVARLVMPACGPPVGVGEIEGRLVGVEAQHVAEEVVVAEPGAGAVEADEQLIGRGCLVQPSGSVARIADGIDELPAHAIENRCAHHPRAVGFVDLRQILVGEVIDHETVVALERLHEGVVVVTGSQRQSSKHQAGGPPLGAFTERVGVAHSDVGVGVAKQQLSFGRREAQRVGANLNELGTHPKP